MWSVHLTCIAFVIRLITSEALAAELGKMGLVKVNIDMLREKKSGQQGELLQVLLFTLSKLCRVGTMHRRIQFMQLNKGVHIYCH